MVELNEALRIAEETAREVHKGQKRTIGEKEDYIEHLKRMVDKFSTPESKIVAWLHDVLEDSELTPEDLIRKGIPNQLVESINTLTRKRDEGYLNYIIGIRNFHQAKIIKIADLKDNLKDLPRGTLRDKYTMALYILENPVEEVW